MPTVPGGGSMGGGTKYQPRVGQGGIGQPGGMIPPPRNGGTPGFPNPRPTGPNVPSPRPIKGGGMVGDLQPGPRPGGGYDGSGINPGGGIMNPRPTTGGSGPIIDPRQLPRNGGGMVGPMKGGGKFAMRSAQGNMGQPRARPMLRPGMGMT